MDGQTCSYSQLASPKKAYELGTQAKAASEFAQKTNANQDHRRAMELHLQAQQMHESAAGQSKLIDETAHVHEHLLAAQLHAESFKAHQSVVGDRWF